MKADDLHAKGLHIEKEKYFCLKADERSIYGKKVRNPHTTHGARVTDVKNRARRASSASRRNKLFWSRTTPRPWFRAMRSRLSNSLQTTLSALDTRRALIMVEFLCV